MKKNQNNVKAGEYYIGLDVGTNSVGWAVTDAEYNLLKFRGNSMWGVRLFEEAQSAEGRRTARTARRRLARQKQRLIWLELLFAEEITKVDPEFFIRLKESGLVSDDKSKQGQCLLFNDEEYTDHEYLTQYPTIYHLRSELIHSKEVHDVRLVFLALHHIIKSRGHFLFDMDAGSAEVSVADAMAELNRFLMREYEQSLEWENQEAYLQVLEDDELGVMQKKKMLRKSMKETEFTEDSSVNLMVLSDMLAGATVKLSELFWDDSLKNAEIKSVSLKNDLDESWDVLTAVLGERADFISEAKKVFDAAKLTAILNGENYISDAKVKLYHKNHEALSRLKKYVKIYCPQKYKAIFTENKEKQDNFAAYSGYRLRSGAYRCNQEQFCTYLKKQLPEMKEREEYRDIYQEIENKTFLPRLKGADNGVIPQQLHLMELECILKNASEYLPFLNEKDEEGRTVSQKVSSIFQFRIPYYVGPLNLKSPNSWAVRTDEVIYPWNFDKVVDTKQSAEKFMLNLIGRCSYTGAYVLPKDSLLYSEYMLRNEINLLRINGKELPRDAMEKLYEDLFVAECKKVTVKAIKNYLLCHGWVKETDEISGVDHVIKSKLKSYHDFQRFFHAGMSKQEAEEIIRRILVFGDDKKMLRKWLEENATSLTQEDVRYICRLRYQGWGRLSKEFLTEVYHTDASGNSLCIMDMLKMHNVNLSHLMSDAYQFRDEAEKMRKETIGIKIGLDEQIENLYLSPAVKRSVRQTMKLVDEIVDIQKSAPKKIFVEVARGTKEDLKGKRTSSRKERLVELYQSCGEESNVLFEKLCNEDENRLRSDKLYLYYTQFGKCMYSGESIDFESMIRDNMTYDIDHIFPRSRVKDDSLDNRVLVKSVLNREKTNTYPIDATVRQKMYPFWKALQEKGLISEKKFTRLVRQTPLTEKELSEFVARQLVETQQSTKAIIALMKEYYPTTKPVFSKAKNVSEFRQKYGFVKCREVNDLHHAKDAYLNIVVGNVYDTKFTENFFKNIQNERYSLNKVFEYDTPMAWKADGRSIQTVRRYMQKNNVLVTRMPREAKGQLFDLMIVAAGKGQLPIKNGRSIEKYGGYNNVSGAYSFLVEHTQKKKRIRTIETVLICDKNLYETNPIAYCVQKLNLCEPKIVVHKIRFDTLLEIDNKKLYITGRIGERYVCKHAYELSLDAEHETYIKQVLKYMERCRASKRELEITEYDGITAEKNTELYDWFLQKLQSTVYQRLFNNVMTDLVEHREVFIQMSLYEQAQLLTEILKAFKCDRQNPDFSTLNKKKSVGIIMIGKNLSNAASAYLIHQSVTGLYEYRTDLLK